MDYYEEADPLPAGEVRMLPSTAPMTCDGDTLHPVRALEEAPDGFRRLDWSGQGLTIVPKIPNQFLNARIIMLNDNKLSEFPQELSQVPCLMTWLVVLLSCL